MNERNQKEVNATLDVLGVMGKSLRHRGYDATLRVDQVDDHYECCIIVRVPPLGVPIESVPIRREG